MNKYLEAVADVGGRGVGPEQAAAGRVRLGGVEAELERSGPPGVESGLLRAASREAAPDLVRQLHGERARVQILRLID